MSSNKGTKHNADLLSELILKEGGPEPEAGLMTETAEAPVSDSFERELEKSLNETEQEALRVSKASDHDQSASWAVAREVVYNFRPVPWFIWRLTNHVFSEPGVVRSVSEGMVLGLRRLLFAAASDPFFSDEKKVNNVKKALSILQPDVIAALATIHAMCRRLATRQHERIWRPILDDALLRSQIGFFVGERETAFGAGRGMLAGFAGRCGLAVLISTGELEQARRTLELLASGADIGDVGNAIYGCDPLQTSAMVLSATGCGRDAAAGTVSYAVSRTSGQVDNDQQLQWLSAFTVVEMIRMGKEREIPIFVWEKLGYVLGGDRGALIEQSKTMIRHGHSLNWIT